MDEPLAPKLSGLGSLFWNRHSLKAAIKLAHPILDEHRDESRQEYEAQVRVEGGV